MKTLIHPKQKKSLLFSFSQKLWITGSVLFYFCCLQYSFAQDYDFQQSDDENKLVVMEAENFTENIPNNDVIWALTDSPEDYSGEGAMLAVTGSPFASADAALEGSSVMTYRINFTESGKHYIWARASRTGGGDDSYHAGIGDEILDAGTFLNFEEVSTDLGVWIWIYFSNIIAGRSYVEIAEPGVHDFKVYIRENGFRIDKLLLTTDSTYIPEDMGPDETLAPNDIPANSSNFDKNLFTLSPNPVREELTVTFREKEFMHGKLTILNLQGNVLRSARIDNISQVNMNFTDLKSGMYFITFQTDDNSMLVRKFVKK